jgi:hypothetical protein
MPQGHPVEASGHWTTSSTPSARTTRTRATPCELQGLQALRQEWLTIPASTTSPTTRRAWRTQAAPTTRRGGVEHSLVLTGRSTSSSEDTGRRRIEGSKSSTTGRSWWQPPMLQLPIGGQSTQSPSVKWINGLTSTILASTCSSLIQ